MPPVHKFLRFTALLILIHCNSFLYGQEVYEFSAKNVSLCWKTDNPAFFNVASDNVKAFFSFNRDGKIISYNSDGKVLWNLDIGGKPFGTPVTANDRIYFITGLTDYDTDHITGIRSFFINSLDLQSGISIWKVKIQSGRNPQLYIDNDVLYVLYGDEIKTNISRVNRDDGSISETTSFNFGLSDFFIFGRGKLFISTRTASLISISLPDKKVILSLKESGKIEHGVLAPDGRFIMSDKIGSLYILENTGKIINSKIKFGAKITSLIFQDDRLFVTSNDNFIYALSNDLKKIIWKKRLGGRIVIKPAIIEKSIIVTSQGDNSIYFIRQSDGEVLNRLYTPVGEEILNSPIFLEGKLSIQTNLGIRIYSAKNCGKEEDISLKK